MKHALKEPISEAMSGTQPETQDLDCGRELPTGKSECFDQKKRKK
jgi:hypothetical protein